MGANLKAIMSHLRRAEFFWRNFLARFGSCRTTFYSAEFRLSESLLSGRGDRMKSFPTFARRPVRKACPASRSPVEVTAKESVAPQDVKSLHALAEERKLKRYLCVSGEYV